SSFAVLIVLLAAISAAAIFGIGRLSETFTTYQRGTDQTLIISGYVESLAAARLADQQFRVDPSPEAAARLAGRIDALAITPEIMDAFSGNTEEQAMLEELAE